MTPISSRKHDSNTFQGDRRVSPAKRALVPRKANHCSFGERAGTFRVVYIAGETRNWVRTVLQDCVHGKGGS